MTTPASSESLNDQELRRRLLELEQENATLREQYTWCRAIIRALPDSVIFSFDRNMRYRIVDGSYFMVTGDEPAQFEGLLVAEALPAVLFSQVEQLYRGALNGESQRINVDYANATFATTGTPLYNEQGELIGGVVMARNINTEVQIQRERSRLGDEILQFKQAVENAPDGIALLDKAGIITYANPALHQMLNYEQLVGVSGAQTIASESYNELALALRQVQAQSKWEGNLTYQRLDGSTFIGRLSTFQVTNEQGQLLARCSVVRDITAQLRSEHERAEFQEQIIAAQQAALRELSTPLIPIAAGVVAMPLVGAIDSLRAQQVMETLLEGITQLQAETAILDITGVRVVDTQVADALLRVAQAAGLLGARVILTGISAEVAQALVTLGADLSRITTRSNLQSAIALALNER